MLGAAFFSLANVEKAIEFHQRGLSIAKEIGNRDLEGRACLKLGKAYHYLGHFEKAKEFHQDGLSIAKGIGNQDLEGEAYISLGNAYHSLGDLEKAMQFHEKSLRIAQEDGKKGREGAAYTNLGIAYNSGSDFQKAIEFHQKALSIAKDVGDKDLEGNACINLGIAYNSLGKFPEAIEFCHRSLSITQETGNKDSEGGVYGSLGNAYRSLGDYKKAIEFHEEARRIAKMIGNKESELRSYGSFGIEYRYLGNVKKAITFYEKALHIAEEIKSKDSEGNAYTDLGNAYYFERCDYQKAVEYYENALRIAKETGNKDSEGGAYGNLGNAYRSIGKLQKAIEFYEQALSTAKEIGNKSSEECAYYNLGIAYYTLNDFKKAINFHQQSLSIAKEIGKKNSEALAYSRLGATFYCVGDLAKAEEFYQSSIKMFEKIRFLLGEKGEWKIRLRDKFESYNQLWVVQVAQGKIIDALCTAERGRAQALKDLLLSQYDTKLTLHEQMEGVINISSHISSPTTFVVQAFGSLHFWVVGKSHEWQYMQKKINYSLESLKDKAYEQIGATKPANCENCSLDDPDETTEELFYRGTDDNQLTSSEDKCDTLKALYDVVIAPISHLIENDELIIIPDGSSFLIPYAALVDQRSRYLSETLRIRLAPSLTSLRLLAKCPERRHGTAGALLVGNPWTKTVRFKGKRVLPLPGAEEEVKRIGDIVNVEPFTGKNATKEQVLRGLNSVSLVHIAAHASAETGEIILSPNLASSKRPKEEDFLLTMTDVLNAKLDTKLVVLSCCHSGRGGIYAEGVVGIARAFLGAGARSVIASLWAIEDEATLAFMRQLYEHLVKGESASKSLHQAMKWMRKSKRFNDVKHWASFVLIGDDVKLNLANEGEVLYNLN